MAWFIVEKYYDDRATVINNRIRVLFELTPCQNASAFVLGDILDIKKRIYV